MRITGGGGGDIGDISLHQQGSYGICNVPLSLTKEKGPKFAVRRVESIFSATIWAGVV